MENFGKGVVSHSGIRGQLVRRITVPGVGGKLSTSFRACYEEGAEKFWERKDRKHQLNCSDKSLLESIIGFYYMMRIKQSKVVKDKALRRLHNGFDIPEDDMIDDMDSVEEMERQLRIINHQTEKRKMEREEEEKQEKEKA